MKEDRSAFTFLTSKPTGNKSLGFRHRWEDSIRVDIKEMDINTRNWFDSVQDRNYWTALVNAALNLRVPEVMELELF